MYVTAIVPAHNEQAQIVKTIQALQKQVDRVIVACDRCEDQTYQLAIQTGAEAFQTVDNQHRKAGALNQALEKYVDWQKVNQYIFVCDADTVIADHWIERAKTVIAEGEYDAVGSVFYGDANRNSMLQFCQQMEWYRYTSQIERNQKVFVLTGTASMISAEMFQKVKAKKKTFYDEQSITEDFALTIDLKEVGAKLISPLSCYCTTEIMPSWKMLFLQRRRWYLGALQQIVRRKWNRILLPYIIQQMMLLISVIAFMGLFGFTAYLMLEDMVIFNVIWFAIGVIFVVERVITVWERDWQAKLFALLLFPELIYSLFLQIAYLGALIQLLSKSVGTWNHLDD